MCNSPETENDYRPITLLNCCLKLITKLLANWLQKVILKIIHKNQYGFLKGRSIQDCLAWAFEYIHQCQSSGRACCILKLDFAKAFDSINWESLHKIMAVRGFPPLWCDWMDTLFHSSRSAVLLNLVPGHWFQDKCGLRQGDPISPYLFVICAEGLSALLIDAEERGITHGVKVCPRAPSVSHL